MPIDIKRDILAGKDISPQSKHLPCIGHEPWTHGGLALCNHPCTQIRIGMPADLMAGFALHRGMASRLDIEVLHEKGFVPVCRGLPRFNTHKSLPIASNKRLPRLV